MRDEKGRPASRPSENRVATKPPVSAVNCTGSDVAGARRLTMGIRLRLEHIAANVEQVIPLIEQAWDSNIHEVLGYSSWTAHVSEELGDQLAHLTMADRRSVVELLAGTGMSTRAIGPVVGVSHVTVARDLGARSEVLHGETPDPRIFLSDEADEIMAMADHTEGEFENALAAGRADGDLSRENVVKHLAERKVTGTDGKTYKVATPASPKRRRRPLPDAYFDAVYDLEKAVNRVVRLHADDRFVVLQEQLHQRHQGTVERLAEALLKVEDELRGEVR